MSTGELQVWAERKASRTVVITEEMLDRYVALSGDSSAIHVRDAAARERGFAGRVVHGFFLGALISGLVGTELPGDAGVIQQTALSFHNPCYIGDRVAIEVSVAECIESVRTLILKVVVKNARGTLLVRGTVQSGITAKK